MRRLSILVLVFAACGGASPGARRAGPLRISLCVPNTQASTDLLATERAVAERLRADDRFSAVRVEQRDGKLWFEAADEGVANELVAAMKGPELPALVPCEPIGDSK